MPILNKSAPYLQQLPLLSCACAAIHSDFAVPPSDLQRFAFISDLLIRGCRVCRVCNLVFLNQIVFLLHVTRVSMDLDLLMEGGIWHIYREKNREADQLSKEGLLLDNGLWHATEILGPEYFEYYHRLITGHMVIIHGSTKAWHRSGHFFL